MQIHHLIPRFPYINEKTIIGGAANALYNLVKQQTGKIDYQVLAQIPVEYLPTTLINIVPLEINAKPTSISFGLLYIFRVVQKAREKGMTPDLVHGHSGYLEYVLATSIYSRIKKIPSIHSVYCPASTQHSFRWFIQKIILTISDPYINKYIAISKNVAFSLHKIGVPLNKIEIIPPIVDLKRFNLDINRNTARKKLGLDCNIPVILFVGSTKPEKNLEAVLFAFLFILQELPDSKLVITTELTHKNHKTRNNYLAKIIEENNLKNNIIQLGIVDEMPEVMASADVLVAPFLNTNGPSDYFQAALEAMAVGRPVVVSAVGGMSEVVDDEVGFLINPIDISDIAISLLKILKNLDFKLSLGNAASERILKMHNPETIEQQIRNVYKSLEESNGA